jgi:hypothetical protein
MREEAELPPCEAAAELIKQRLKVNAPWTTEAEWQAQVPARERTNRRPQRRGGRSKIQTLAPDAEDGALRHVDMQPGCGAEAL